MTASTEVPTSTYPAAARVALIGDTHDTIVGPEVHDLLLPHLRGADLILHCGDLSSLELLDLLGATAPVLAVRSTTDPDPAPPVLVDGPRLVVVAGGFRVELRNKLTESETVERDDADVIVYSAHQPRLHTEGTTIYLSPGSPSLSKTPTMAVLDLSGDQPTSRFVFLRPSDS